MVEQSRAIDVERELKAAQACIEALQNALIRYGARVARLDARVSELEKR